MHGSCWSFYWNLGLFCPPDSPLPLPASLPVSAGGAAYESRKSSCQHWLIKMLFQYKQPKRRTTGKLIGKGLKKKKKDSIPIGIIPLLGVCQIGRDSDTNAVSATSAISYDNHFSLRRHCFSGTFLV